MATLYSMGEAIDAALFSQSCCAFGVFDGVHRGHRFLIERMLGDARARCARSVVLTFDRDPDELFCADGLRKLMGDEERIAMLSDLGADALVVIPFTRTLAAELPEAFLDGIFATGAPQALHVGCDFRFGAQAAGTVEVARAWGATHGMLVEATELLEADGAPVTATRIRALLAAGDVEGANDLLGHPFEVSGTVEVGRGEGADMGIATANLHLPVQRCALAEGVYAAYATVAARRYKAAVSAGVSPTFADRARANMEVHLLDFDECLYGVPITVSFCRHLRPMIAFDSVDDLVATVTADISWVRENL